MARPAGCSSDEYSDDDEYGLSCSINTSSRTSRTTVPDNGHSSKEEKLIKAISNGQLEEVQQLVNNNVKINYQSKDFKNWTPLMHACYEGNFEIIKVLLENKASTTSHCNLVTPLLCLCDSRNSDEDELIKSLDILINHGADLHAVDWYKESAIVYAIRRSYGKLVFELLSRGCELECLDSLGWTPVFHAVNSGNLTIVKILKDAGADMTRLDKNGNKLIDIAYNKNYEDIVNFLSTPNDSIDITSNIHYESDCDNIILEQPDLSKGILYGYHNVTIYWICGIGLESLKQLFVEKNIQLNEILTKTDVNELEQIGVKISFDRKKILYCVQKFHEHNWGKNSLPCVKDGESLDFCGIANFCSNILFRLHIINAAVIFWKKKKNGQSPSQIEHEYIINILKYTQLMQKETREILEFVKEIEKNEPLIPSDLIKGRLVKKPSKYKFLAIPIVFLGLFKLFQPKLLILSSKIKLKIW